MPNVITVDFRKAPPQQGGGTDHIAPGRYLLTCTKGEIGKTNAGAQMVTLRWVVARGDNTGKRLNDRFPFPDMNKAEPSYFGLSRLHALMKDCMGIPVPADKAFKLNLDLLLGKQVWADVADNNYKDKNGNERVNSNVAEYVTLDAPKKPEAADDDEEEEPDADDEAEEEEEEEEEAEEVEVAPTPISAAAAVPAEAAPKARKKPKAAAAPEEAAVEDDADEFPF